MQMQFSVLLIFPFLQVHSQLSPLLILLNQLKESYNQRLVEHRNTHLAKQAKKPAEETFFPVKLRDLFSFAFSMRNIQEAFKTTGENQGIYQGQFTVLQR